MINYIRLNNNSFSFKYKINIYKEFFGKYTIYTSIQNKYYTNIYIYKITILNKYKKQKYLHIYRTIL